jgi:hypothetical protein
MYMSILLSLVHFTATGYDRRGIEAIGFLRF